MTGVAPADLLGRALYEALTIVAGHPALALPLARARRYGTPVGRDTELVIEGFPRSGTSFAVAAFQLAQARPVRIAHHLHAPANLIAGVRRALPCLLVIRRPEDAVVEWCVSKPTLTLGQSLRGYIRFHRSLLAHRHGLVAATHEEVMGDLAAAVRRLNERFETRFAEPSPDEDARRAAVRTVERESVSRSGGGPKLLGPASLQPEALRDPLRKEYARPRLAGLRRRADALYSALTAAVPRAQTPPSAAS